jgi:hypothetical protein
MNIESMFQRYLFHVSNTNERKKEYYFWLLRTIFCFLNDSNTVMLVKLKNAAWDVIRYILKSKCTLQDS